MTSVRCAVGTVVDGVAVGVGEASIQMADVTAEGKLESVVLRLAYVIDVVDAIDAVVGAIRRCGVAASDQQVVQDIAGHRAAIY